MNLSLLSEQHPARSGSTAAPAPSSTGPCLRSDQRLCPSTGLALCLKADFFVKANAVCAVLFLLIGGIGALLLALTRWQTVHLLPTDWFYRIVTLHGINMLIFWILFFEVALLYFLGTTLIKARLASRAAAWVGLLMMIVGAVMTDVTILLGQADVMLSSYLPLLAHPAFYLGIILVAVGCRIAVINFLATLYVAKKEKTYQGSLPLVLFGAFAAAVIAVGTLLHGALVMVPTFLHSVGRVAQPDPQWYRLVWWGLGHMSQQVNVCAMVASWYFLATLTTGARPLNELVCHGAFVLWFLAVSSGGHRGGVGPEGAGASSHG